MTGRGLSLDDAIMGAAEAPPSIRIEFRDPIARYGVAGIARVMPWLTDPKLSVFAVRVIARAADFDAAAEARRVLQGALPGLTGSARSDAVDALQRLGGSTRAPRIASSSSAAAAQTTLAELVEGRVYRRRDIHDSGLGGNRQKGISYPAQGSYVLLFSDTDSAHEWGYHDSWLGNDRYRYYGEWNGTGDMLPTGGNLAIQERAEIHLFVKVPNGHRYAGRFAYVFDERIPAVRDGREYSALVFTLERRS
jgi:hypothetical protein